MEEDKFKDLFDRATNSFGEDFKGTIEKEDGLEKFREFMSSQSDELEKKLGELKKEAGKGQSLDLEDLNFFMNFRVEILKEKISKVGIKLEGEEIKNWSVEYSKSINRETKGLVDNVVRNFKLIDRLRNNEKKRLEEERKRKEEERRRKEEEKRRKEEERARKEKEDEIFADLKNVSEKSSDTNEDWGFGNEDDWVADFGEKGEEFPVDFSQISNQSNNLLAFEEERGGNVVGKYPKSKMIRIGNDLEKEKSPEEMKKELGLKKEEIIKLKLRIKERKKMGAKCKDLIKKKNKLTVEVAKLKEELGKKTLVDFDKTNEKSEKDIMLSPPPQENKKMDKKMWSGKFGGKGEGGKGKRRRRRKKSIKRNEASKNVVNGNSQNNAGVGRGGGRF